MSVVIAAAAVAAKLAAHKKAQDEYTKADHALVAVREVFVTATKELADAEAALLKAAKVLPVVQPIPVVTEIQKPIPLIPSGGKHHAGRK